jgi:molybdopterin-guanine dinucleotide biosynthesis adapter protein
MASGPPLIGIVGWKNSGKTTLVERLVAALTQRGLKVATVKHTHHELRARDGTTDGERHAQAGAIQTAVISPSQWEIAGKLQRTPVPALDDIARRLGPVDIVLVEGFKSAAIPKIEVQRSASQTHEPLAADDSHVIAIAADHAVEAATVPVFALDDIQAIAAFIIASTGLKSA